MHVMSYAYNDIILRIDIDECASSTTNDCQQKCINTPGDYTCSCYPGYDISSDDITCNGMNTDQLGRYE